MIDFRRKLEKYGIQVISALVACMGLVSDGMQYAWVSPAVPKLLSNESYIHITKKETEWVAQSYLIGCIFGALISFVLFKHISRKLTVLVSSIPIAIAWAGLLLARTPTVLYASRFIGGIGRNMIFVSVPMYLGEIADPEIRGILGTFIHIMFNVGALITYSITPFFPLKVSCSVGLTIALSQIIFLVFLPESPYYLLSEGKFEEAKRNLQVLRRKSDVDVEFKELSIAVERQMSEKGSFSKLFTVRHNLKAVCILFFLRTAQMFSGVSVMTMNIHTIFNDVGGSISTNISAIIYAIMMLTSAIATIGTMDRFGRKPLMLVSCLVAAAALFVEGGYFYFKNEKFYNVTSYSWLPIVSTFVFVYGYRFGLGTVPIVMIGELLNVTVKVPGVILSDIVYTSTSFASNAIFYATSSYFGMYAPFCIFGVVCIVTAAFSQLFIPETRGKTLEEIQMILMNKKKDDDLKAEKC